MKHTLSLAKASHLLKQRNALSVITGVMLITNLFLVIFSMTRSERIIVVPPDIKQSFWIEKGQVSGSYLEEMASFFTHLALDRSPESVGYQNQVLLRYVTPESYGALKAQLMGEEEVIKRDKVSTHFHASKIFVDQKGMKAQIEGTLSRFVGQQHISSNITTFILGFSYLKGKLFLDFFKEDVKNDKS